MCVYMCVYVGIYTYVYILYPDPDPDPDPDPRKPDPEGSGPIAIETIRCIHNPIESDESYCRDAPDTPPTAHETVPRLRLARRNSILLPLQ